MSVRGRGVLVAGEDLRGSGPVATSRSGATVTAPARSIAQKRSYGRCPGAPQQAGLGGLRHFSRRQPNPARVPRLPLSGVRRRPRPPQRCGPRRRDRWRRFCGSRCSSAGRRRGRFSWRRILPRAGSVRRRRGRIRGRSLRRRSCHPSGTSRRSVRRPCGTGRGCGRWTRVG